MRNDVVSLFSALVSIPSKSGSELDVNLYIKNYLKGIGIVSHLDRSGGKNNSNSGNLICSMNGRGPHLLFVAHVDTVEKGDARIVPVIKNGAIRSTEKTILGVDNKASVAALLSALARAMKMRRLPNITCVFSTREESGIMGVTYLKMDKKPDFTFVMDGPGAPGMFIGRALGHLSFNIEVYGKESHAANHPELGRNAILAASMIISMLYSVGKRRGERMNIGKIYGGTATNVIPGKAVIEGEVRSFKATGMLNMLNRIESVAERACSATGCRYRLIKHTLVHPYALDHNRTILKIAEEAAEKAGVGFSLSELSATCEANILARRFNPILVMASGGKNPHSDEESITVKQLRDLEALVLGIMNVAKGYGQ